MCGGGWLDEWVGGGWVRVTLHEDRERALASSISL